MVITGMGFASSSFVMNLLGPPQPGFPALNSAMAACSTSSRFVRSSAVSSLPPRVQLVQRSLQREVQSPHGFPVAQVGQGMQPHMSSHHSGQAQDLL
jgi:hypothetical protein